MTLDARILLLLAHAPRDTRHLAQLTQVERETLECTLQRMKREGQVRHQGRVWHLPGVMPLPPQERNRGCGPGKTQREVLSWLAQRAMTAAELVQRLNVSVDYLPRIMDGLVRRQYAVTDGERYEVTESGRGMAMGRQRG